MKIFFLCMFTMLCINSLFAQTDFSGNWKLTSKEFISGPQYGNAMSENVNVKQTKDSINTGKSALAINGAPTIYLDKEYNRKIIRTFSWSVDKRTAIITTGIYEEGSDTTVELTRIDSWTLSPDSKQLTIERKSVETKSESWEVKGIYIKQ